MTRRRTSGPARRSRGVVRGARQEVRRKDVATLERAELETLLKKEIKRRREAERRLVEAWREGSRRGDAITTLSGQLAYMQALQSRRRLSLPALHARARNSGLKARLAHLGRLPGHFARRLAMAALRVDLNDYYQHPPRPLRLPLRYRETRAPEPAPKVSVVTPSFNSADFIGATLHSVLDQDYPDLEYICQDGASRDGTADILKAYEPRLKHWASEPDSGQTQAINRGFAHSSGEIMAWLNSDDLFLPGSIAYAARYLSENPDVDVVYGHRVIVDENNREIGRWILPAHSDEAIKYADYIPQETMFWRRSIWEKAGGGLDEDFRFAMDWDLILRFQAAGAKFVRLPRFMGAFRAHAAQKSQAAIGTVGFAEMDRLRERALGYRPSYQEINKIVRRYKLRHAMLNLPRRLRGGT